LLYSFFYCIHEIAGSVTSNSDHEPPDKRRVLSESPVEGDEDPSDLDFTPVNGYINGGLLHQETFVQGHSKDGADGATTRDVQEPNVDDEREEEEEEEEEEDDEENDEEDEDEDEPALKYERLGGAAADLLEKDTASAVAVSLKFLVSACSRGRAYLCFNASDRYWAHTAVWCTSWIISEIGYSPTDLTLRLSMRCASTPRATLLQQHLSTVCWSGTRHV
jgi:hypothetical protein